MVILEKICQLAQALGIEATVEGIETGDDLERVRACGAAYGQGYFLARPMPAQEVPAWLASDAGLPGEASPEPGLAPTPLAWT